MGLRHFRVLDDLSPADLRALIARAQDLATMQRAGTVHQPLIGRVLAMIFEKASTRTRLSFEAGMDQLGGDAIFLSPQDTQLGRGEPIADTARVIGRMCDAVMIRANAHETVTRFAEVAGVPVINALTDRAHPCQLLADLQTVFEHKGDIRGRQVAWIGDGNNMCRSWINAARLLDFDLRVACPPDFGPPAEALTGSHARQVDAPAAAAEGADVVATDVWASMGQEAEQDARHAAFSGYCVDEALMERAAGDAIFLHCLPAHRGEEVSAGVIDGPQSMVWQEAENRLHAQKALLELLLGVR